MSGVQQGRLEFDGIELVSIHRPGHNCKRESGVTVTGGVRHTTLEKYRCKTCWGDNDAE